MRATKGVLPDLSAAPVLVWQAGRFVVGGFANTALTFVVYWGLLPFIDYRLAYVAAFLVGILFLTIVNARYVFETHIGARTVIMFAAYQVGYFLTFGGLLALVVERLGINAALAPLLVLAVVTPVNFWVTRSMFNSQSPGTPKKEH